MQDLPQLQAVYQDIIRDMCEKGIDIWDEVYPRAFFADDIRQKSLYVLCDDEIIDDTCILHEYGYEKAL